MVEAQWNSSSIWHESMCGGSECWTYTSLPSRLMPPIIPRIRRSFRNTDKCSHTLLSLVCNGVWVHIYGAAVTIRTLLKRLNFQTWTERQRWRKDKKNEEGEVKLGEKKTGGKNGDGDRNDDHHQHHPDDKTKVRGGRAQESTLMQAEVQKRWMRRTMCVCESLITRLHWRTVIHQSHFPNNSTDVFSQPVLLHLPEQHLSTFLLLSY